MRFQSAVLAGVLCLFATAASADISRVSPTQFDLNVEDFINIYGTNLLGSVETIVVFDGQYNVEPSFAANDHLLVFVPTPVTVEAGEHTLVVRSVDAAGVRTHGPVSFTVSAPVIDPGGPPLLSLPEVVIASAERPEGTEVTWDAFAFDANGDVPVTCTPASGSLFRLGRTAVSCSATNTGGTSTGGFYVLVTDVTPPVITVPEHIISDNPVVTFTATAVDNIDGTIPVTCSPASGSTFPGGTTTVRCSATDASANRTTESFLVSITGGPPALILPDDILEEATGPTGAVVTFSATADLGELVTCTPASGATFAIGTTHVSCSASNSAGTSTGGFDVTVADTTGPEITGPSLLEVEATSPAGAIATYVVTAHDLVDGDVTVTCGPPSGSQFPLGATEVFCGATDSRSNGSVLTFQVLVQDTTAPTVTSISATPSTLWPPNHTMADITVTATLVDAVDPSPTWKIVSVTSNQPDNGTGDGDQPNDIVITGDTTVRLRSEWSRGAERVYTITIETKDATGNVGLASVTVRVTDARRRPVRH